MSRYGIIRSEVWTDDEFEDCSVIAKIMYLYFLTCESCNYIGYFRIKPGIIATETGIPENEILPELLDQKKLWKYDADTKQVLIPTYLKYNPIKSDTQVDGIGKKLMPMKICSLHKNFLFSLQKYVGEYALKGIPKEVLIKVREMCKGQETPIDITLYRQINKYI